jgi:hypothetical protein
VRVTNSVAPRPAGRLLVALILAATLLGAGCTEETTSGPEEESCTPLAGFPGLSVGSWWIYERTEWESQVPDQVFEYASTVISADSLTSGGIAYRLVEDMHDESLWLRIVDCELRLYDRDPETARDYTVPLRTPLEVGHRWQYSTISLGGYALEAEILSVTDTVQTPAGAFYDCVHIHVAPYYDTWISLTDGIVAAEYTELNGDSGWRDALMDRQFASGLLALPVPPR